MFFRVSVKRRLGAGAGLSFFFFLSFFLFGNRFLLVEKVSVGIERKILLNKLWKKMELSMWPEIPSVGLFSCKNGHVVNHVIQVFSSFSFHEHGRRTHTLSNEKRARDNMCYRVRTKKVLLHEVPTRKRCWLRWWTWLKHCWQKVLFRKKV